MSDAMPGLHELAEMEHTAAQEEYRLLLDQQFRLSEKIRIGALTLNAASLAATMTALGNDEIVAALGGTSLLKHVGAAFLAGALFGAASIYFEGVQAINRVTQSMPRLGSAIRIRGLLQSPAIEANDNKLGEELALKVPEAPVWSRSRMAEAFLTLSNAFWAGGAIAVMLGLLEPELGSTWALVAGLFPAS